MFFVHFFLSFFGVSSRGMGSSSLCALSHFFVGSGGGAVLWWLTLVATREATSRLVAHLMEFGAGVHKHCVLARVGVVPAVAPPLIFKKCEERIKKGWAHVLQREPQENKKKPIKQRINKGKQNVFRLFFRLASSPCRRQRSAVPAVFTKVDHSGFPGVVLVSGSTFQHCVT